MTDITEIVDDTGNTSSDIYDLTNSRNISSFSIMTEEEQKELNELFTDMNINNKKLTDEERKKLAESQMQIKQNKKKADSKSLQDKAIKDKIHAKLHPVTKSKPKSETDTKSNNVVTKAQIKASRPDISVDKKNRNASSYDDDYDDEYDDYS